MALIDRFLAHMEHLFANERDRKLLLSWMAHIVQTGGRSNWAPVIQGAEGDGKTTIGVALALSRIEAHYFAHDLFLPPEGLLGRMHRIGHLPAEIVQGRYDMVCPPRTAFELAAAWPQARLTVIPDAGHSALEPGVRRALVAAVERFRNVR